MAYTIVRSDGITTFTIQDDTYDTSNTSLTLPGRSKLGYGQVFDTNLVRLLENFASGNVPTNPIRGQLWYNTSTNTLNICPQDGTTNASAWLTIPITNINGTSNFVNVTVSGNVSVNNLSVTNDSVFGNSITTNTAIINKNVTASGAFFDSVNTNRITTGLITTGSATTSGSLTGAWTVQGHDQGGNAFNVISGNISFPNSGPNGIKTDNYMYANGAPYNPPGTYSSTNVHDYLTGSNGVQQFIDSIAPVQITTRTIAGGGNIIGTWTVTPSGVLKGNIIAAYANAVEWRNVANSPVNVSAFYNDAQYLTVDTLKVANANYSTYSGIANVSNSVTTISAGQITTALGFTPYDSTNPNTYLSPNNINAKLFENSPLGYVPVAPNGQGATGTWNINIKGNTEGSAVQIQGGAANTLVYQTSAGATNFVSPPSIPGTVLTYEGTSGAPFGWTSLGTPGIISMFAGSAAPAGYLLCDGTTYPVSTYPNLATALGKGSDSVFTVPDLRNKFLVGSSTTYPVNTTGGNLSFTIDHTLLATHNHLAGNLIATDQGHTHQYFQSSNSNQTLSGGPSLTNWGGSTGNTTVAMLPNGTSNATYISMTGNVANAGTAISSLPGTNGIETVSLLPPYYAINYIIKT